MAEIRPFRGIRYNPSRVKDLAAVVCPPYDIIPPQMREELYQLSEYNFVRLEYTHPLPDDKDIMAKYARAAATLEEWLKQSILETAQKPAFYLHDHYFRLQGKSFKRRGIVTLVKLEDWSKGIVRPHEGTLKEPKGDRLNLLWALQANTSAIFALFTDKEKKVASLFERQAKGKPMLDIPTPEGERHVMWAIDDKEAINELSRLFANQLLYIADGHHRYESALAYSRERRACAPSDSGTQPYDYAMMTLVDFADPGLVILPAHRLVRGLSAETLGGLLSRLEAFFTIEKIPLNKAGIGKQAGALLTKKADEVKLLLAGLDKENLFVLRLRDFNAASEMMPSFHSDLYRRLDVSVLDHVILEKLLGVGFTSEVAALAYSYDREDAVKRVLNGEFQIGILLNPVLPESIRGIADAGDRMPRKSTYFYPKLPAGLVFYKMG